MNVSLEATANPGPNAKWVMELRIEKSSDIWGSKGWWGLWIAYWLYPRRKWREWLFSKHFSNEIGHRTCQVMICGLEATWHTTAPNPEV